MEFNTGVWIKRISALISAAILIAIVLSYPGCHGAPTTSDNGKLTISVDQPRLEVGIDYSKTPLTVTGKVSNPDAEVTINGMRAEVSEDGRFSARIQLTEKNDVINIVATLGEEVSRMKAVFISGPESAKTEVP